MAPRLCGPGSRDGPAPRWLLVEGGGGVVAAQAVDGFAPSRSPCVWPPLAHSAGGSPTATWGPCVTAGCACRLSLSSPFPAPPARPRGCGASIFIAVACPCSHLTSPLLLEARVAHVPGSEGSSPSSHPRQTGAQIRAVAVQHICKTNISEGSHFKEENTPLS